MYNIQYTVLADLTDIKPCLGKTVRKSEYQHWRVHMMQAMQKIYTAPEGETAIVAKYLKVKLLVYSCCSMSPVAMLGDFCLQDCFNLVLSCHTPRSLLP